MRIVIIGSGNVATHLAKALYSAQQSIEQVYSRNISNAKLLAAEVGAKAIDDLQTIAPTADLYVVSVKDDALASVIANMPLVNGVVVHTAGSISVDVLVRFPNYGVFYPFQTFTKHSDIDFSQIPVLIESNSQSITKSLIGLASKLSNIVLEADSKQRGNLHISAVFACNFVNHMYRLADELLSVNDLPFGLLHPLIKETAEKVQKLPPSQTQTGPAGRNDVKIIEKHLDDLSGNTELYKIYETLTASIVKRING